MGAEPPEPPQFPDFPQFSFGPESPDDAKSRLTPRRRNALAGGIVVVVAVIAAVVFTRGDGGPTEETSAHSTSTTTSPPTTAAPTTAAPTTAPPTTAPPTTAPPTTAPPTTAPPVTEPPGPPPGARPGPGNTGNRTPEDQLRRVTAQEVEDMMSPGAVIEGVMITSGDLDVVAPDVTLRDFVIDGGGSDRYGIRSCGTSDTDCGSRDWPGGFTAEDGVIRNVTNAALWGGGVTLRRIETTGMAKDAWKPLDDVTIEASWSHGPWGTAEGAHADWVQFQGEASNVLITGNTCAMGMSTLTGNQVANACIQVNREVPSLNNVTVSDNWMDGGNYTVNCAGPSASQIEFRGNVMGQDVNFGSRTGCSNWSGNTYEGGAPA